MLPATMINGYVNDKVVDEVIDDITITAMNND
jgi:hypothetical protein